LWQDFPSWEAFKFPKVEILCTVPIRLHIFVANATWESNLEVDQGLGSVIISPAWLGVETAELLEVAENCVVSLGLLLLPQWPTWVEKQVWKWM